MASRLCGCATAQCTCVVQAGDGVDVTGTGSPSNPYIISATDQPLTGKLVVQDTATVDLTLTGQGTLNQPWVLSADATIALTDLTDVDSSNTTDGYVLARQPDGTFAFVPPSTAPTGAVNTDASIDGDGSSGSPLSVNDYDNLARLEGSNRTPNNLQSLILGDYADPTYTAFSVRRQAPSGYPNTNADIRMRIYSSGPATGSHGVIEYYRDNVIETDLYLLEDGVIGVRTQGAGPVRPVPYAFFTDTEAVTIDGGEGDVVFTFPNNRFTQPPTVVATSNTRGGAAMFTCNVISTTTDFTRIRVERSDGGSVQATRDISIIAIQMSP